MIREVALSIYLLLVRILFRILRMLPVQNKTVMLSAFGDNIQQVINQMPHHTSSKIIVLKEPQCTRTFQNVSADNVIDFSHKHIFHHIKGIYHLATSKVVFVDSYHAILAACDFKKQTTCIQLWHANGAVKLFGLKDKTIDNRQGSAHRRFKNVYRRFHKVVVSSDAMADIFKTAFGLSDNHMLKTGVPRTDFFHSKRRLETAKARAHENLPQIEGKQVILYAPTFRDGDFEVCTLPIDVAAMQASLGDTCHLLIHLHPAVNFQGFVNTDFATDVSKGYSIFELLSVTDILITDYSSIPFEFSTLKKPMIFYPYDLKVYEESRGIWFDYATLVPGPIVYRTSDIIDIIDEQLFDMEVVETFDKKWNMYADGQATCRLLESVYN
ncbi:CDP-glycerol glycerophosphotransferase family protein [Salinicoccus sesuvii]|uniref:CDP-glycerol glycerophosphotransferase family protein n=1 Tax=Salinicoccus sesuvii TaxID=868281 RepID=A0ABV7N679_9STAP